MTAINLYLPTDAFSHKQNDVDLAADYLELTAFFSPENQVLCQTITKAVQEAIEEDYATVEEEIKNREEPVSTAIARINQRRKFLDDAYPFDIDDNGDVVTFTGNDSLSVGQAAYLVSLVLSHLKSVSDVMNGTPLYPRDGEIRNLRSYFQYFATAGLAAEIGGPAWSFGHPRPDRTGFIEKLSEIWIELRDGCVNRDPSAPAFPQDDQVDVFAWRKQQDGLPGFLLAAAQVTTGANWKSKSVKGHVAGVFASRWFNPQPVTTLIAYHIIPFARPDDIFRDDVLVLGNILHRLRLPFRVMEAEDLVKNGIAIEAFEELPQVIAWLQEYKLRGMTQ